MLNLIAAALLGAAIFVVYRSPEIDAYNIDTTVPVVKQGVGDSYFGYSLTFHYVSAESRYVLLVGAPRDNVTDPTADRAIKETARPGVVYRCPLTSLPSDCSQLAIDVHDAPMSEESKTDQWLGVSVVSQGTTDGKALACAHRYRWTELGTGWPRWGLGVCYSLTNDLNEDMTYEPCEPEAKTTKHQDGNSDTYLFGFCQAGTSAAVCPDGNILLGAPGVDSWRGMLFKTMFQSDSVDDLERDTQWYWTPVGQDRSEKEPPGSKAATNFYSNLGMSTKIVTILNRKYYVGGAPRGAKSYGQVLIFHIENKWFRIAPEHVFTGSRFGAGFGYDFVVADFNGDGKEDLVVGAPFYHAQHVGGAIYIYYGDSNGITSAVEPKVIFSRKMSDQECKMLHCHDARFGSALATIGDTDRDGYQDLAVGAPYEGSGAVYIFRGSSRGIKTTYSQRIAATDLFQGPPPKAFGSALAGNGVDFDRNGYPDLAVGSFQSSTVVVLRSRPVVNLFQTTSSTPTRVNRKDTTCTFDKTNNICFQLRVCFKFTAEPRARLTGRFDVDYQVDGDKYAAFKPTRVVFAQHNTNSTGVVTGRITMNPQSANTYECATHIVYLAKSTTCFLTPMLFQLTYKLRDVGNPPRLVAGSPLNDINNYPITNVSTSAANFTVEFAMNCGDDHVCNSSLSITSFLERQDRDPLTGRYKLNVAQTTEIVLTYFISNAGEDAHRTALTVTLPDVVEYRSTVIEGPDKPSCSSDGSEVYCDVANPLGTGRSSRVSLRLYVQHEDLLSGTVLDIVARVSTSSLNWNEANSQSTVSLAIYVETDLGVIGRSFPEEVLFGGTVLGESAIETEEQIGSSVVHVYEMRNLGNVTVHNAKLVIRWPYEFLTRTDGGSPDGGSQYGKHVLYLLEEPYLFDSDGERGYCHQDQDNSSWINPLNIRVNEDLPLPVMAGSVIGETDKEVEINQASGATARKRREAVTKRSIKKLTGRVSRRSFSLECSHPRVRCHRIECVLGKLEPKAGAAFRLRFRLWNHTFVEEFSDYGEVLVYAEAEVLLSSQVVQINKLNDHLKLLTTARSDISAQEPGGVPIWIIIVAVVAGVILLLIIIIIFWRCGFFNRKRRGETPIYQGKIVEQSRNSEESTRLSYTPAFAQYNSNEG